MMDFCLKLKRMYNVRQPIVKNPTNLDKNSYPFLPVKLL
jgi:hypothetical protein